MQSEQCCCWTGLAAGSSLDDRHPGELRTPNAAAQTRTVSARRFWLSQRELPRHLKQIVRPRIPEFESYMPSQAVASPALNSWWSRKARLLLRICLVVLFPFSELQRMEFSEATGDRTSISGMSDAATVLISRDPGRHEAASRVWEPRRAEKAVRRPSHGFSRLVVRVVAKPAPCGSARFYFEGQ